MGAVRRLSFVNQRGRETETTVVRQLVSWTRAVLRADDEVGVSVLDIDCGEDGCCAPETVILIMRADRPTEGVKIRKAPESITYTDIETALASDGGCDTAPRPQPDERC